jgi:hypothetical protein
VSKIVQIYNSIVIQFKQNPQLERKVQADIGKLVTQVYQHALASSEGFC